MWSLREKPWSFVAREGIDLEQRVTDWLTQQGPADWLSSSLILGALLLSMVLFAVSRLG